MSSYPTLVGANLGYAGGAEAEQVHLGKELAAQGHDVCFITYSGYNVNRAKPIQIFEKIKIIETYERERDNSIGVFQKYKCLFSALRQAKADIYFHESGAVGVLPLFCYLYRARHVYRIPSDSTVLLESLSGDMSFAMKTLNLFEMKKAHVVLAQNNFQKEKLKERFGVESYVLKNGLSLPWVKNLKSEPPFVLWVGSISRIKRPHLFLELAKSMPFANFEMIGGRGEPPFLYDEIANSAQRICNLNFNGFIPSNEVGKYFQGASVLVNTSSFEGFPNTFIQAWAHYTPVISLNVNPDGVLQREKIGFHSKTFNQLVSDVKLLFFDKLLRNKMGQNARKYVEREHDIKIIVHKYCDIFEGVLWG